LQQPDNLAQGVAFERSDLVRGPRRREIVKNCYVEIAGLFGAGQNSSDFFPSNCADATNGYKSRWSPKVYAARPKQQERERIKRGGRNSTPNPASPVELD
jgi:hypothetical protein